MDCPICKQQMKQGVVPAERAALCWRGETEVRLSKSSFLYAEAEAFYCPECRHVMIPVPEIETFSDEMWKKLDDMTESVFSIMEKIGQQRKANQEQKKYEKRKGKDPWEM